MITDVKVKKLKVFSDERGSVKHMLKSTDEEFTKFGEIYFSEVLPGKVKAWNRRKTTTRNYCVIEGKIKLVLYDENEMQEMVLSQENHSLVVIPPGVWAGFKALDGKKAILADLTDNPYDESDAEKQDFKELEGCWDDK
jgi:dTDP-4-dehydrorhamnose 3,5-epimerase